MHFYRRFLLAALLAHTSPVVGQVRTPSPTPVPKAEPQARPCDEPTPDAGPNPAASDSSPRPAADPADELEPSVEAPGEAPGDPAAAAADDQLATGPTADDGEIMLEQLSILGAPEEIPRLAGSVTVIDKENLERMERDDIHRVLEAAPGVYVRGEDGYGLRPNIGIRGASSERSAKVTLMEDGVLLGPAPYSAPAAYYFPLVTRMTAVEVFKGPASIRFGPQTVGGALNMTTRPIPEAPNGGLDLSVGQYRAGKVHGYWGQHSGPLGVLLEGVHLQSDGFKQLDGDGSTGFKKNEAMLKLRYRSPIEAHLYHQLDLKLGYADEHSNETYLGISRADFADNALRRYRASQLDEMNWWRSQVQLSYLMAIGDELAIRATAYRHDFHRVWDRLNRFQGGPALGDILANPDRGVNAVFHQVLAGAQDSMAADETLLVIANDRRFVSQGLQIAMQWDGQTGPATHDLELGARVHFDSIERDHRESGYLMQGGVLVPDGQVRDPIMRNEVETLAVALHVRDEFGFGQLHITPGVRVELIGAAMEDRRTGLESTRSDTVVMPGVAVHYQLLPSLAVLGGVHKGFSPVVLQAPAGPDDDSTDQLEPEDSTNYELGARFRNALAAADLIGFFNDYDNLVAVCTFSSGCGAATLDQQFNAGRVFIYGFEAVSGVEVPVGGGLTVGADVSYTLTRTSFRTNFSSGFPIYGDVNKGDELPYVPIHTLTGTLRAESSDWALSAVARYASAMRAESGQGDFRGQEGGEELLIFDLGASYSPGDRDRLYLTVENLLDTRYIASVRPFGPRPGKPLQISVGYKHRFGP